MLVICISGGIMASASEGLGFFDGMIILDRRFAEATIVLSVNGEEIYRVTTEMAEFVHQGLRHDDVVTLSVILPSGLNLRETVYGSVGRDPNSVVIAEDGTVTMSGFDYITDVTIQWIVVSYSTGTPPPPPPPLPPPPSADEVGVVVNGRALIMDVPPVIRDGRTFVPLRAISEALGADVSWRAADQTIIIIYGPNEIHMSIGSMVASLFGIMPVAELDVPPFILDGRTMVPLRAISELFGYDVGWDGATRTVTIDSPE